MITAKEAKQLYDESGAAGAEVAEYLKHHVEQKIIDAAKGSKRFVFVDLGAVGPYEYVDNKLTPLDRAVVDKLVELGYRARVCNSGAKYVPRGLAEDDGSGPLYQNYGIHVGW